MRRKRRQPARVLARTNEEKAGREQEIDNEEERRGMVQVFPDKTSELIRKAAISNVIKDKRRMVDTNIKI